MRYLLNNCTLITKQRVNVLIDNGIIVKVSEEPININVDRSFNLDKKLLLPGLMDVKVNTKYVDSTEWTIHKESKAYLKGGITSVIEIPFEPNDGVHFNDLLWKNIEFYNKLSSINFTFAASTDLSFNHGTYEKQDFLISTRLFLTGMEVNEKDKESVKLFLLKIEEVCSKSNAIIISMKDKNINLFFKYFKNKDVNIGFFNISTIEELNRIKLFKKHGYNFFSIMNIDTFFISEELVNTPIKKVKYSSTCPFPTRADLNEFNKALINNEIDIIVPNHIPTKLLEKFELHKIGNPGAETFISLIFDLILYLGVGLDILNNVLFLNFKKFLKINDRFEVKPGNIADLMVVDIDKFWFVSENDILSTARWTQYEGKRFWGVPLLTIINGQIGYEEAAENKFPNERIKCRLIQRTTAK